MINAGKGVAFFIVFFMALITTHTAQASEIESLEWLPLLSANVKKMQPDKACPQNQIIDLQVTKIAKQINSSIGELNWDVDCRPANKKEISALPGNPVSKKQKKQQIASQLNQLSSLPSFELQINSINLFSKLIASPFSAFLSIEKTDLAINATVNSDLLKARSNYNLQTKKLSVNATVDLTKVAQYIRLTDEQKRVLNGDVLLDYQSDLNRWHQGQFKVDWKGDLTNFSNSVSVSILGAVDLLQTQLTMSTLLFNAQQVMVPISDSQNWKTEYIKLKNTKPISFNYSKLQLEALPIDIRIGKSNLLTSVERGKSKRIRIDKQGLPPLLIQLNAIGKSDALQVDWALILLNQKLNGNLELNADNISLQIPRNTISLQTLVTSAKKYVDALDLVEIESGEVSLDLSAQYNRDDASINFKSVLNTDQISGKKDNIFFDGVTLNSHLEYVINTPVIDKKVIDTPRNITIIHDKQQLKVENVFVGVPIQALQVDATLNGGEPVIEHFKARLLGGRLDLDDFKVNAPSQTVINLSGISLAEVIKYSAYPEIKSKALLDGMLPLVLTPDGPEITDGIIFARPPGGFIKVPENTVSKAMGRGNPALSLTMQILTNFQFDTLQGNIGYTNDGESNLNIEIKGISPTVSGTQPINFNYTHNENILKLLKSLRFNDELVRDIKERY